MKEYKFLTIHSDGGASNQYSHGEKLIGEYVEKGWSVEHVTSTNTKGELIITLSKTEGTQLLNG